MEIDFFLGKREVRIKFALGMPNNLKEDLTIFLSWKEGSENV